MTVSIYIPGDSAAVSVGADAVAEAIATEAAAHHRNIEIIRTGSRGLYWLEPLVEVSTERGRVGFGPVAPEDVPALVHAGLFDGEGEQGALGLVDDLSHLKAQTRLTTARCGVVGPSSIHHFRDEGGFKGLEQMLAMAPEAVIDALDSSGLRGRGGAGFPVGRKWRTVLEADGEQKYIACNADEGDSGTFSDRMIMEGDPFTLIEGMVIAGIGVGATRGYVYLRSEYPDAIKVMRRAVEIARAEGVLGGNVLASGQTFDMEIRVGAGAYVCGEETSLLNSLEGKRGVVRAKPPLPALEGFLGRPTVVNNVISLATVPVIFEKGAQHYADFGMGRSRGTVTLQIAGNVAQGGLFETAFGISLGEIVNDLGGGTASGRPVKAVQVGGPLGSYLPVSKFSAPMGYEELDAEGGLLGHAGLTVFDDTADMLGMARFAMEFCAVESCGKCTPCRIGAVRGVETIDRIAQGDADALPLLADLCETMKDGSLCALGGFTPLPVMSAVTHFHDEFVRSKEAAE